MKLRRTVEREARIVSLDDAERDAILAVLADPPDGLAGPLVASGD